MAAGLQPIVCPQCGAKDVRMESETQGVCEFCGARFTVQPRIENIINEIHIHPRKTVGKSTSRNSEILSSFTEKDFLRKAWISFAKEGAPLDIFSEDFGEVKRFDHHVVHDTIDAEIAYSASIGHDREEPYTAYETYYEREPYTATESYYDSNTKTTKTHDVIKYREVPKERPVTKYKTVTDWSPISSTCRHEGSVYVENREDVPFEESKFLESFMHVSAEKIIPCSDPEDAELKPSASAKQNALKEHNRGIELHLKYDNILPGDHFKDLTFSIVKKYKTSTEIYKAPRYEAGISFRGKTYTKEAFPFGEMSVFGDSIKEDSLGEVVERMKGETKESTGRKMNEICKKAEKKAWTLLFASITLILVSILLSIFVRVTAVNWIGFGVAIVFFFLSLSLEKRISKKESDDIINVSDNDEATLQKEIDTFTEDYRRQQRQALERKFSALGFAPLTDDEF